MVISICFFTTLRSITMPWSEVARCSSECKAIGARVALMRPLFPHRAFVECAA